ncbi:MAG: sarcosine oxidase subunit delta [Acidiferrobacteraceae bacterium]|nr:sarcosine oxidase subunit delta [Acidiferrobacteraceae bacterium]
MLIIRCPWCGLRDEAEYSYGGEADIKRPLRTKELSNEEWADYLFFRKNTKGPHDEQWCHIAGCGRWFNKNRNTITYSFDES